MYCNIHWQSRESNQILHFHNTGFTVVLNSVTVCGLYTQLWQLDCLNRLPVGMLNDYRILDYQIKCSFAISFVAHSILEQRGKRPAKWQTLNSEQYCIGIEHFNPWSITCMVCAGSAVPTVEATEAVASAKIDVAQLKRLVVVYKISLYKLATCFADSFEIIAFTRSTLFNTKCITNRLAAGTQTVCLYLVWIRNVPPGPPRALTSCAPSDLVTRLRGLD